MPMRSNGNQPNFSPAPLIGYNAGHEIPVPALENLPLRNGGRAFGWHCLRSGQQPQYSDN
jgi:hypothetical protein